MSESSDARSFSATRWSVVLAAAGDAQDALATLCRAYWYPLFAFLRRQGLSTHDAEDVTQGFFVHILEKNALANVDRAKGRFRTFLLASLKHFLADERDRANAQKRGGGRAAISLDACKAEERYALEPRDELSPDKLFDRRWAIAVIERALTRLGAEYFAAGKGALFSVLKPLLTAPGSARPRAEIGAQFAMNEGAVKVAVHRLRQRYGAALREEIAETVGTAEEVEEELRHLLDALGLRARNRDFRIATLCPRAAPSFSFGRWGTGKLRYAFGKVAIRKSRLLARRFSCNLRAPIPFARVNPPHSP